MCHRLNSAIIRSSRRHSSFLHSLIELLGMDFVDHERRVSGEGIGGDSRAECFGRARMNQINFADKHRLQVVKPQVPPLFCLS